MKMSELLVSVTRRNLTKEMMRERNQTHKKEYILHDSISIYFKIRQNCSVVLLRKEEESNGRGMRKAFEVFIS